MPIIRVHHDFYRDISSLLSVNLLKENMRRQISQRYHNFTMCTMDHEEREHRFKSSLRLSCI